MRSVCPVISLIQFPSFQIGTHIPSYLPHIPPGPSPHHRTLNLPANTVFLHLPDSGMKEDLNLYGNELNYANAVWSAAYVFGQIPSNLLLTRVNAPLYIAFLELAWTVFTFATAGVKDVNMLYVFRFL